MGIELTGAIALFWIGAGIWGLVYTPTDILRRRRLARDAATYRTESRANLDRALSVRTGFGPHPGTGTDNDGTGPGSFYLGQYRAGTLGTSDSDAGRGTVRRDHGGPSAAAVFLSGKPHRFHASPVIERTP